MYTRSNYDKRQNDISVPFNYSGNAFRNTSHEPETKIHTPKATVAQRKIHSYDENDREKSLSLPEDEAETLSNQLDEEESEEVSVPASQVKKGGLGDLSDSLGKLIGGIGSEELLIIALMLTVYLAEGESADSEQAVAHLSILDFRHQIFSFSFSPNRPVGFTSRTTTSRMKAKASR